MIRPPFGLCLPCQFRLARDGGMIEITLPGSERVWVIHLKGLDVPKRATDEGRKAKHFVETVLEEAEGDLAVWISPSEDCHNLLGDLSFDRLLGDIWVGTEDRLSEMLVRAGHARRIE